MDMKITKAQLEASREVLKNIKLEKDKNSKNWIGPDIFFFKIQFHKFNTVILNQFSSRFSKFDLQNSI